MNIFKKIMHYIIELGCCWLTFFILPRPKKCFNRFCVAIVGFVISDKFARKVEGWFNESLELTKCELQQLQKEASEDEEFEEDV